MALADLRRAARERLAPWLIWAAAVSASIYLWVGLGPGAPVRGFAEAAEYHVTALAGGRVSRLAVARGDHVTVGQTIAILDPTPIDAELRLIAARRARAEAEILRARTLARGALAAQATEQRGALGRAQVATRDARATLATKRAERRAVQRQLREQRALVERGHLTAPAIAPLEIRATRLAEEVTEAERGLALRSEQEAALQAETSPDRATYTSDLIAPLAETLSVLDAREATLRAQRAQLTLRAPIAGEISLIEAREGEAIAAKSSVVTIVADNHGRVLACVPEERILEVALGDLAELRRAPAGTAATVLNGHTVALSPVVELPTRCRRTPNRPRWGREVTIELDPPARLIPGRAFDVRFNSGGAEGSPESPPQAPAASDRDHG